MEPFKRALTHYLFQWKKRAGRKPLIIRGARQVGKTTLVKDFSSNFRFSIFLNLEKAEDRKFFEDFENVKDILDALFLKHNILPRSIAQTLLFIDEIQESSQAIKQLRYFYEEFPELSVIAAGSLLEFAMKKVKYFPVGRVEYLYLHPMNYPEFLDASGRTAVKEQLNQIPVQPFAHGVLMELFHRYAIIGGMPEVIKNYLADDSLAGLQVTYESIWETYKNDVEKYAGNEKERNVLRHIMATAPFLH